jgi:hypothetical protein
MLDLKEECICLTFCIKGEENAMEMFKILNIFLEGQQ